MEASGNSNPVDNDKEETVFYKNRGWKSSLLVARHIKYCRRLLLSELPTEFEDYDTQRINFLHFLVATLDILQATTALTTEERTKIIDWIYLLQVSNDGVGNGFQGSAVLHLKDSNLQTKINNGLSMCGHITMTFSALLSLLALRDDLSRVDRKGILEGIGQLQNKDGSFRASPDCGESDMRFVYSAVATCFILDDFSPINIPTLLEYVGNSFTYEGSCGSGYGAEGHAAYTFCAIASLILLNKLSTILTEKKLEKLKRWCLFRQEAANSGGGFTGRPNKDQDTCYSFWVGATLTLLQNLQCSSIEGSIQWILSNQNPLTGGIGKYDSLQCDPLHSFMGIAGLSLVSYEGLQPIIPELTMTKDTFSHLKKLQELWQSQK